MNETSLVLDTNILNAWRFREEYAQNEITSYISRFKEPPALTSVTVFEKLWGLQKRLFQSTIPNDKTRLDLSKDEELIQSCRVLPFDEKAARIAAYVFAGLSQSQRNEHWADVFIASTALAHGCGVATRDVRHFELIGKHLDPDTILRLAKWKP